MIRENGKLYKMGISVLLFLTVLSGIKAIFVSLDIDESYAVAQAYRMACGDRLLLDMWEPHQFSAFLGALFIKPYLMLFHTTDYLVIYLRIAGLVIHTGLGIWLYRLLRNRFSEKVSFLILLLHLNFLPKWVQMPEFEVMHYWFLLAVFCFLYSYFADERGGARYPFFGGVCLVGSMLSYPTMIILYPFYMLGLAVLERQKKQRTGITVFRSGAWFTAGAMTAGLAFLAYLFSYLTPETFRKELSYVFLDESHTLYTAEEKMGFYLEQFREQGACYLKYLLVSLLVLSVVFILLWVTRRMRNKEGIRRCSSKDLEYFFLAVLILAALGLQLQQILGSVFRDQNQFYMQLRYFAAVMPAVYLGIRYLKKYGDILFLCVLPAVLSLPAALVLTNMSINVAYSRIFLGVLGSSLMLAEYGKEQQKRWMCCLQDWLAMGILCGLFVCRLVLLRVTGCQGVTILAPMEKLQEGPAKGVYVLQQEAQIWNENYRIIREMVDASDVLLYVGAENLVYVTAGSTVAAPSTQGTTVYNEMYLYYYEEHPEKLPNVVVDKTFGENPNYYYSPSNQVVLDWLEETYADADVVETTYLTFYFRNDS